MIQTKKCGRILVVKPFLGLVSSRHRGRIKFRMDESDAAQKHLYLIKPREWGSIDHSSDIVALTNSSREDSIEIWQRDGRPISAILDLYSTDNTLCQKSDVETLDEKDIDTDVCDWDFADPSKVVRYCLGEDELHTPGCPHHLGKVKIHFSLVLACIISIYEMIIGARDSVRNSLVRAQIRFIHFQRKVSGWRTAAFALAGAKLKMARTKRALRRHDTIVSKMISRAERRNRQRRLLPAFSVFVRGRAPAFAFIIILLIMLPLIAWKGLPRLKYAVANSEQKTKITSSITKKDQPTQKSQKRVLNCDNAELIMTERGLELRGCTGPATNDSKTVSCQNSLEEQNGRYVVIQHCSPIK